MNLQKLAFIIWKSSVFAKAWTQRFNKSPNTSMYVELQVQGATYFFFFSIN